VSAAEVDPVEGVEPVDGGRGVEGADRVEGGHHTAPRRARPLAAVGSAVREVFVVVVMALVLSFVVKTWLLQAFFIPSGSMEDTLLVGDRVIVSKLSPTPFDIQRGDVVVFQDPGGWLDLPPPVERSGVSGALHDGLVFVGLLPAESEDHLIKRVIGLPGDRVACCTEGKALTVNGVALTEPYLKPGDVPSTLTFDITVPEGQVWVMGDHRSDSEDSRFHDPSGTGADGAVPIDDITGRAVAIVWPLDRAGWLSNFTTTFAGVPDAASTP
jgi:signal peptidase I